MDNSKEPKSGHQAPAARGNKGPGPETSAAMDAAFGSSLNSKSTVSAVKSLVKGDMNGLGLDK